MSPPGAVPTPDPSIHPDPYAALAIEADALLAAGRPPLAPEIAFIRGQNRRILRELQQPHLSLDHFLRLTQQVCRQMSTFVKVVRLNHKLSRYKPTYAETIENLLDTLTAELLHSRMAENGADDPPLPVDRPAAEDLPAAARLARRPLGIGRLSRTACPRRLPSQLVRRRSPSGPGTVGSTRHSGAPSRAIRLVPRSPRGPPIVPNLVRHAA